MKNDPNLKSKHLENTGVLPGNKKSAKSSLVRCEELVSSLSKIVNLSYLGQSIGDVPQVVRLCVSLQLWREFRSEDFKVICYRL